jgi:hypothetical protein
MPAVRAWRPSDMAVRGRYLQGSRKRGSNHDRRINSREQRRIVVSIADADGVDRSEHSPVQAAQIFSSDAFVVRADDVADDVVEAAAASPPFSSPFNRCQQVAGDFSVATWDKNGGSCSVSTNSTAAPDGNSTGNGYRLAELMGATNPSGWSGVLKVKNPAGMTAGYILLYSNP